MQQKHDERGVALLMALVTAALVTAVATTMVMSSSTDLVITGNTRASTETLYAAEAAGQRAIGELATIADWSTVLAPPPANVTATFDDGKTMVRAPDGRSLSVPVLTASRQAASATTYGPAAFGADSPVWRLFGHADFRALLPPGVTAPPAYVLIYVADDGGDDDGDPQSDANGQLIVYAEAYGVSGAHRAVELAVLRVTPGTIRVLSWKDPR
jgi:hypothetical protein